MESLISILCKHVWFELPTDPTIRDTKMMIDIIVLISIPLSLYTENVSNLLCISVWIFFGGGDVVW
jgi:hypothetical protein